MNTKAIRVLLIGAGDQDQAAVERLFKASERPYELMTAGSVAEGIARLQEVQPGQQDPCKLAQTLVQVARTLNSSLDRDQVLQQLLAHLGQVVAYDSAAVMLVSDGQHEIVAHRGFRGQNRPMAPDQYATLPHVQEVLAQGRPVIIQDTAKDPGWHHRPHSAYIRSWLGVPLMVQGRVIGMLNLDKEQPGFYTGREAEMAVAFADQAAIALENARLYQAARQAEQALQESNRRYQEVVSSIPGAVYQFLMAPDGSFSVPYMSAGAETILDLPLSALTDPAQLFKNVPPDDLVPLYQSIDLSAQAIETWSHSFRITTGEGEIRWMRGIANPRRLPDGGVIWNGVLLDITEYKQARAALQESERRYRTLFERTGNPVLVIDPEGNYIDCNAAALEFLASTRDELLTKNVADFVVPGEEEVIQAHRPLWAEGGARETNYYVHGEVKTLDLTITPARWQGRPVVYGIGTDVTARKRTEERLRAALQEKQAMLAEIHHRVKNNMQIISSLLDFQADHAGDERTVAALRESQRRIHSMALVHEGLYGTPDLARIDFAAYVQTLTAELFANHLCHADRVKLELDVPKVHLTVGQAIPCGLLVNELVSNALEHAFPAGARGEVRVSMRAMDEGEYVLAVSDDGVGLPPNFQLPGENGLGLFLIEAFVQQLGGQIACCSDGDRGTTCRVVFPIAAGGSDI